MEKGTHSRCPRRFRGARCVRLMVADAGSRMGRSAMSKWCCGNLLALGCLVLAGCGAPPGPVTPAEAVAQLRTGRPLLNCREACVAEWQRAQPQAGQLAAGRRWADLAALTVRIGYQDALSLCYLGQ